INENYRGEISLTGAAQVLNMNSNYVSQLFKKETGITFVHYVTQKRLEDAKELLSTTKKPLTDIALEVGFNDTFHFIKTFKKVIGMTPGQYRMSN
ncbi:MAG: helix-turn-helix transcriptional regulator, partial [Lachnospiraceae bacterium]|nr:helix-turn-helix transcriptional regulator [Lachnospiraceae bacterium]